MQKPIYFEPGKLGIMYEKQCGVITEVHDGQANQKGVQAGWVMQMVDGKPYDNAKLQEMLMGQRIFEVVFFINASETAEAWRPAGYSHVRGRCPADKGMNTPLTAYA